ncbi:MAG: SusD/RagB family nutrient-binding outer membrane lipoprotein [Cyclobacteriaceae bacterium]|nr:SusD/RagB family nutrient-binding outer membrane lipoprotein [Cyclobacteriaceae bacterium]
MKINMKKITNLLRMYGGYLLLSSIVLVVSCTSEFDDINTNKNALSKLEVSQLPFLFSKAQSTATNNGWNYQIAQNLFHDQYCQYFANTTTYFPSDRLVIRMDWIRAAWNPIYSEVVPQLQTLLQEYDPASAEYAIAQVWWVYTFHRLTDTWGPVPYFNAGVSGESVPYDAQDVIYDDMFKRLAAAITVLNGKKTEQPYGTFDLIYGGDVNKWIRFANTLRLRLAIRISKADATRAKTEGEAAVAGANGGVLADSPGDDALIFRTLKGDDFNGLTVMDWNEFRMSSTMESVLKGYNDPRMAEYFSPAAGTGSYDGLRNGLPAGDMALPLNSAANNSNKGPRWNKELAGTMETPSNVMATAEAWFLRAEGVLLGWNMGGGTAEQYYNQGITESMNQWGITDATAINNYINSLATPIAPGDAQNSPAVSTAPIKYRVAGTLSEQREQITIQKWLSLFPEGVEAWADIRRSGAFKLYPVVQSDNTDLPTASNINVPTNNWIRRIPFITDEKVTNGAEVTKAVPLLGGSGDKISTPLWWDKN